MTMAMQETLQRGIMLSLIAFNLIAALLLLLRPNLLMKINILLNKWFSTSKIEEVLNKRRDIDGSLMGLGKLLGIISLLTSAALIYFYIKLR